jgi:putative ABC transport system ATP-binding protein
MKIELRNIRLTFSRQALFDGLNYTFPSGAKTLLHGPSGSGKSTLLRLILGYEQAQDGQVLIDGMPLSAENIWSLRKRMAYVPQDVPLGQGKVFTFLEDIFAYRANQHLSFSQEETERYFKTFQLPPDTLEQPIEQLSGGERQRVAIITALLLKREVYLLDEATSALDETLRQKVIAHFAQLKDCTVIAVAHQTDWEGFEVLDINTIT